MNDARSLANIRELVIAVLRVVVTTNDLDLAFGLILNHLFEGLKSVNM